MESSYHSHFKRRLLCRRHFVLRLSERSLTIHERTCRTQLWESPESCYLCGIAPIWVCSKMNNWGQFYILISEDVKMKQWATNVHAFQNHFVLVCSDECKHKESQKISRQFLPFFSPRFFENLVNARDPLPRKKSVRARAHTHTHTHTHTFLGNKIFPNSSQSSSTNQEVRNYWTE